MSPVSEHNDKDTYHVLHCCRRWTASGCRKAFSPRQLTPAGREWLQELNQVQAAGCLCRQRGQLALTDREAYGSTQLLSALAARRSGWQRHRPQPGWMVCPPGCPPGCAPSAAGPADPAGWRLPAVWPGALAISAGTVAGAATSGGSLTGYAARDAPARLTRRLSETGHGLGTRLGGWLRDACGPAPRR